MLKVLAASLALATLLAGTVTNPAAAQVRIGIAGPMSGAFSPYGAQMAAGAAQAAAAINARGGLGGERVELVPLDDLSDPQRAETIAQRLVEEGVIAVIGHFTTGASNAAAPIYADAGIVMITPSSTDPTLTERDLWNVFRVAPRDDHQGDVAGRHLATEFGNGRIAIVHDKTAYGKGLADRTRQVMNDLGVTDVLYAGIDVGEPSYAALVTRLREADVDAVYFGGLHAEGAIILRQMREAGIDAAFIAGDGILSPAFVTLAGEAAQGALMTAALDFGTDAEGRSLMAALEEAGLQSGRYALSSFIALRAIEEAARIAGSTDPRAIAQTMRGGTLLETEIGPISFDPKGDATFAEYGLFAWREGESGFVDYRGNLVAR
jgi:branched-chain amino acid transport system substrate-binding protein